VCTHYAPLQTAAAVLVGAFVAGVAVGFYLQFTSSDKTLSTDYCYSMQPWSLLLAIVIALTYPTIWLNRCVLSVYNISFARQSDTVRCVFASYCSASVTAVHPI
jgi:hypothetical protein